MKYFKISVEYEHSVTGIPNSKIHSVEINRKQSSKSFQNEDDKKYFYDGFPQLGRGKYPAKFDDRKINEVTFFPVGKRIKEIDVIRHSPMFVGNFIISKRTFYILKLFKLPEHSIIPVKIDTFVTDYFLVGFSWIEHTEIDFTKSIFYDADTPAAEAVGYKLRAEDKKQIMYNSYEEYKEAYVWKQSPIEIHLNNKYGYDIINIRGDMYFSEKLTESIEENKIIGFKIKKEIILINDI